MGPDVPPSSIRKPIFSKHPETESLKSFKMRSVIPRAVLNFTGLPPLHLLRTTEALYEYSTVQYSTVWMLVDQAEPNTKGYQYYEYSSALTQYLYE
jgi:hypothetical protein